MADVLRDFEVHGIAVDRIVVTLPFAQLSAEAKEELPRSSERRPSASIIIVANLGA